MARKKGIPIEIIIELHNQGLYDKEIADIVGCKRSNITKRLNQIGLGKNHSKINDLRAREKISKSLIGRYVGESNPNFKGYTDEKTVARGIFKTLSKKKLRESNYTCQHCGKHGGNLETHHIKPFAVIFEEFVNNYYDNNIDNLYVQLMSYPDFIDENNLVVLCKKCHKLVHYSDNPELSPYRWKSATTIPEGSTS